MILSPDPTPISLSRLSLRDDLMVSWIISIGILIACFLSLWLGLKNYFDSYSETITVSSSLVVAFICVGLSEQCHGFVTGRMALTLEEEKKTDTMITNVENIKFNF